MGLRREFSFKDDEVITKIGKRGRFIDIAGPRHATAQDDFPLLQELNHFVQPWLRHTFLPWVDSQVGPDSFRP